MGRRQRWQTALGAFMIALGILAGAFAAHAQPDPVAADWMRTAGLYLMIHGLAALVLPNASYRISVKILCVGACLFAATLLAMAAGAPRWLGAVTPAGGVLMIAGWLGVAVSAFRRPT